MIHLNDGHVPAAANFGALQRLTDEMPGDRSKLTIRRSLAKTRSPNGSRLSEQRQDKIDYYIIFAFAFVIMLWAVSIQRCLPRRLRSYPSDRRGHRSIIEEARGATRDIMPFAFMG